MNALIKTLSLSVLTTVICCLSQKVIGQNIHYQYDDLNRLTEINYNDSLIIQYAYDELGNRTTSIVEDNTTTDVVKISSLANIKVFPNPVSDVLSLEVDFLKPVKVLSLIIYNNTGQLLYRKEINTPNDFFRDEINISHLPSGTYILEAALDGIKWSEQFIIQKI